MNKKYLLLIAVAIAAAFFLWRSTFSSSQEAKVTSKPIISAIKPINYESDLNFVVSFAGILRNEVPTYATLASDVIAECERMRSLFAESFKNRTQVSLDFILQVHPPADGGAIPSGYDPERSRHLISQVLLQNKYDLVTIEGSGFDGFSLESQAQEVAARIKYEIRSPLYVALQGKGLDPASYPQIRPYLLDILSQGNFQTIFWRQLEEKSKTLFLAGESIPLSAFVGKFITGELGTNQKDSVERIQRVRSMYAVAKTITDLKQREKIRGAVIFGFLHERDFQTIASSLGVKSIIYNATGK